MMRFGAHIPLTGVPFPHDPARFPKMKDWQKAAALEVIYRFVQEGKVLGPFQETARLPGILSPFILPSWYRNPSRALTVRFLMHHITEGDQVLTTALPITQRR